MYYIPFDLWKEMRSADNIVKKHKFIILRFSAQQNPGTLPLADFYDPIFFKKLHGMTDSCSANVVLFHEFRFRWQKTTALIVMIYICF